MDDEREEVENIFHSFLSSLLMLKERNQKIIFSMSMGRDAIFTFRNSTHAVSEGIFWLLVK